MLIDTSKYYVFYDGDCGFCNHWVQWILKNDTQNQFLFSALQSEFGQAFLTKRNLPKANFNTIYLWKPNEYYFQKSKAILKITHILGGKYKMVSWLGCLPRFLTDIGYDIIAKNRMKLASQKCYLPTNEEKEKFI
ncbi:MAG: thiol-disulfide oxidoreductase [Flavobacteriales bacterium]|nr:MAG: thiol-disulfide oxidoreductase [Flavobacteriales bacterium]